METSNLLKLETNFKAIPEKSNVSFNERFKLPQEEDQVMINYGRIVRVLEGELTVLDMYNDQVNQFNSFLMDKSISSEDRMIALEEVEVLVDERDIQIIDSYNALIKWYKFTLDNNIPVNFCYYNILAVMRRRLGFR